MSGMMAARRSRVLVTGVTPRPLKESPAQDDRCYREIDDESGDVHQCRDEGRRGGRGIEAQSLEYERERRSGKRPPQHDSDQGESHGHGDQEPMRAIQTAEERPAGDPSE